MSERLDPKEGVGEAHVRRDDLLHREDLVELLRRHGLLEDTLHEHTDDDQSRADEYPAHRTDRADRRQHDGDGDESRAEADHLVPQDERLLLLEQFVAPEKAEIQQRTTDDEVREREQRQCRQPFRRHPRAMRGPRRHRRPREKPVGTDERQYFTTGVDPARLCALAQDKQIGNEHTGVHTQRGAGSPVDDRPGDGWESQEIQRTVLREGHLIRAQQDRRREDENRPDPRTGPAMIVDHHRAQQSYSDET